MGKLGSCLNERYKMCKRVVANETPLEKGF